jgi:hypothetical protein
MIALCQLGGCNIAAARPTCAALTAAAAAGAVHLDAYQHWARHSTLERLGMQHVTLNQKEGQQANWCVLVSTSCKPNNSNQRCINNQQGCADRKPCTQYCTTGSQLGSEHPSCPSSLPSCMSHKCDSAIMLLAGPLRTSHCPGRCLRQQRQQR